jgi:glyoxylate reductase
MPYRKSTVIVTRRLPEHVESRMGQLFDARFNASDTPMDAAALKAAVADCDVLART